MSFFKKSVGVNFEKSVSVYQGELNLGSIGARGPPAYSYDFASKSLVAAKTGKQGDLNLFKFGSEQTTAAKGWKSGDRMLNLHDKGTPKVNWKNNSGALRSEMSRGKPIYDSYLDAAGNQISTKGFLNAERNLLKSKGWNFNSGTGTYHPPAP